MSSALFEALAGRARKDQSLLQLQEEARQADRENQQTIEKKEIPAMLSEGLELRPDKA